MQTIGDGLRKGLAERFDDLAIGTGHAVSVWAGTDRDPELRGRPLTERTRAAIGLRFPGGTRLTGRRRQSKEDRNQVSWAG